jgi:excisionase family DNA binding protein
MVAATYMEKVAKSPRRARLVDVSITDTASTDEPIQWLSTAEAANRLGITPRTLYRFIDEGQLAAYRFGRVIRLKTTDVDLFIEACRIQPGTLEHLYPETVSDSSSTDDDET